MQAAFSNAGVRKTLLRFLNAAAGATRGRASQRLGAGLPGPLLSEGRKGVGGGGLTHRPTLSREALPGDSWLGLLSPRGTQADLLGCFKTLWVPALKVSPSLSKHFPGTVAWGTGGTGRRGGPLTERTQFTRKIAS